MQKSLIITIFLSLILSYFTYAQTITISKPIPISNRTSKFKLLGKNNNGYWVRNYGKNEERIDIYDDGMNLVRSKTLLIKRSNFSTVSYFLGLNQATIYYTEYKKKTLFLCAFNINDRLESGAENILDTINYQSIDENVSVSYASSSNKLFHMFFIPLYENGNFNSVKLIGTNGSSHAIYRKKINISIKGYTAIPEDAIVNNTGITFLLVKYQNNSTNNIIYNTYLISNKGEVLYSKETYFNKSVFNEPFIIFDEKNQEYVATAFTTDDKKKGANFFTSYRFSLNDTNYSNTNHYKIDKEIINEIYNGDAGNIEGLYTYNIKKIILTSGGGIYAFTESYFKENKEELAPEMLSLSPMNNFQPSYNNTRSVNVYHYNDVLCLKLNDSTKRFDYELISKKQISENDNGAYSSFVLMNAGDKIKCMYNSEENTMYSFVDYTIDKNENSKNVLLNEEKKGIQLIPKMAIQTGLNELIIPSYRNDEFKLVKIKY